MAANEVTAHSTSSSHQIPGQNMAVIKKHCAARNIYICWKDKNEPQSEPSFDKMKCAKILRAFASSLQDCSYRKF